MWRALPSCSTRETTLSANITGLGREGIHFIGSLSPSHYPELCSIRLSRYTPETLENGREILAFDTKTKAFDRSIRVVLMYNSATARKKERRFQKNLGQSLAELNQIRWAKVKDPEAKIRRWSHRSSPLTCSKPRAPAPISRWGSTRKQCAIT